jgi:hypothetical protein
MSLQSDPEFSSKVGGLSVLWIYEWFRGGVMTEGGAGGFDIGWEFRFIEWFFRGRVVLFGHDVIDGLFHLLLFFICLENTTDRRLFSHKYSTVMNLKSVCLGDAINN